MRTYKNVPIYRIQLNKVMPIEFEFELDNYQQWDLEEGDWLIVLEECPRDDGEEDRIENEIVNIMASSGVVNPKVMCWIANDKRKRAHAYRFNGDFVLRIYEVPCNCRVYDRSESEDQLLLANGRFCVIDHYVVNNFIGSSKDDEVQALRVEFPRLKITLRNH